jgi:hypothetical protein
MLRNPRDIETGAGPFPPLAKGGSGGWNAGAPPRPGTGSRAAPQITPRVPPSQGEEGGGAPGIPKARGHDPGQKLPARAPWQGKLEPRRKNAQRVKAEAQEEVAKSITARNQRVNERKPRLVSAEDVAKAEGELKLASAQIGITEVEIAEVEVGIQQLQRWHERARPVIGLADRAKAAAPARPTR